MTPPAGLRNAPEAITTSVSVTRTPLSEGHCEEGVDGKEGRPRCHRFIVARFDVALIVGARIQVNAPVCDSPTWTCPLGGDRWMDTPLYEVEALDEAGHPFRALALDTTIPPELASEATCQDEGEKLESEHKLRPPCPVVFSQKWRQISAAAITSASVQGACLGDAVVCVEPINGIPLNGVAGP